MKAIIIDDEQKAQNLLEILITQNSSEITEIFKASTLLQGIELIKKEKPQIVFLDIDMPQHSGLEILDYFDSDKVDFQIIFVTAYSQYAIEAFKIAAVDYILKPVDVAELTRAITKAQKVRAEQSLNNQIHDLKKAFRQMTLNKIALEVPKGIIFASEEEILYFKADGMYTHVNLKGNRKEVIGKPLKYFVEQLKEKAMFYKPHRSFLINLKHIKELTKKDGFYLTMEDNSVIPVSKDKREEFLKIVAEVF